ncbi:helix-turn-helix domain-containing protein [Micromonospora carbonacea]|uniref:helix-turn-helix domain-containing protein n=1 Tax=Micromonospora carbonacea TaxID=47853 RepID=UPI0037128882
MNEAEVERPDPEEGFRVRMRQLRQALGCSQQRFAEEMSARGFNWHQTTVAKVEVGQRLVSLAEALGVADALGAKLDDMVAPLPISPVDDDERAILVRLLQQATEEMKHQHRAAMQAQVALAAAERALEDADARRNEARRDVDSAQVRASQTAVAFAAAESRQKALLARLADRQHRWRATSST